MPETDQLRDFLVKNHITGKLADKVVVAIEDAVDTLPPGTSFADLNQLKLKEGGKHFEEAKRRGIEEQIRYYEPYGDSGYQKDFHESTKRRKLIWKTNRAGGTTALVAEFIWWLTGTHPYRKTPKAPVKSRLCCVDFEKGIEGNLLPKFKEMVRREDLKGGSWEAAYSKVHRVLHFKNKSFVEFMSYDQDVEKFGGVPRNLIGEDEPCPQNIHNENVTRLVDTGGTLIIDFTPVNLSARTLWLYDLWRDIQDGDSDWDKFFFDYRLNKSMTEEQKDDFNRSITDPVERESRIYGRFPQLAGLVFKNFSRSKNVPKSLVLAEDVTRFIGVDPHTREKNAVLYLAVNREGEYFAYNEIFEHGGGKVMVDLIKARIGEDKIECNWMDDYGRNVDQYKSGMQVSIWQEFLDPDGDGSNKGIYCLTIKMTEKLWQVGVRRIRSLLGLDEVYQKPRLFISEDCPLLIRELETCIYEDYKYRDLKPLKETVKKKGVHLISCLMFMLLGGAEYVKLRSPEDSKYKSPYPYLNKYTR